MPWIEPIEGQSAKAKKKDHLRWPTLAEQWKILGTKAVGHASFAPAMPALSPSLPPSRWRCFSP